MRSLSRAVNIRRRGRADNSVGPEGGARSEGQGGPRARARQRALSLTAVSTPASSIRSNEMELALDDQHGIYRVIVGAGAAAPSLNMNRLSSLKRLTWLPSLVPD